MVGNAGVIKTEVVLVSRKADNDNMRWVYLDIGKFSGLAGKPWTGDRYQIVTRMTAKPNHACWPARPATVRTFFTKKTPYPLPVSLTIGDKSSSKSAPGAYTTTYSAVAFNGFEPLDPTSSDL